MDLTGGVLTTQRSSFTIGSIVRDLDVFTVFVDNGQRHGLLVAKVDPGSSSPGRESETLVPLGLTLDTIPELASGSRGSMIINRIDLLWPMTKCLATLISKASQLCRVLGDRRRTGRPSVS